MSRSYLPSLALWVAVTATAVGAGARAELADSASVKATSSIQLTSAVAAGLSTDTPIAPKALPGLNILSRLSALTAQLPGRAFAWAITRKNTRLVEWLLEAHVNPNVTDPSGMTPLLHAVVAEEWKVAERLLARRADPDAAGPGGVVPLMITASAGNVDALELLLRKGAKVDVADEQGRNAAHYALTARNRPVLERLLEANVPLDGPTDLFSLAAQTEDWNFIEPVLERYEKRPWDDSARKTVQLALKARDVSRLRLVLSKHPGPATPEGCKDPLLVYAIVRNDLELARLLLEAGSDPNTTLSGKAEANLVEFVSHKILRHYLSNEPGMTVLCVAAGMGNEPMVRLLMQHGAERNRATKSKHRLIPLYFAAWENHVECLQTLIGNAPKPEEMRIEISLGLQEAVLYKDGRPIFRTAISSGKSETPTQTGRFVVTDKKRSHVSNLYDAKMPFFMRLSCKDFGLHEGHLPGYPASHGCIRLPGDSARKLFSQVPIGTLVTIR